MGGSLKGKAWLLVYCVLEMVRFEWQSSTTEQYSNMRMHRQVWQEQSCRLSYNGLWINIPSALLSVAGPSSFPSCSYQHYHSSNLGYRYPKTRNLVAQATASC